MELAMGAQMNFLEGSDRSKDFIDKMRRLHEKMSYDVVLPKNMLELVRLVKWYGKWIEDRIEDRIQIRNTTPDSSDSGLDSMTMSKSYDRRTSATFGAERYIFIDRILDEYYEGKLSKEAIVEETKTFIMAGQETTASSIYHTLIALCQYPKVQAKLIAEIDDYFDSNYVYVENSDFENLPYLDAVVRESLRFYPSAPHYPRTTESSEVKVNEKYTIPKNAWVFLESWAIHRDKTHWGEDAEEFNPERWFEDKKRHAFAWIPFAAGARNCIGQRLAMLEIKIVLIHIFKTFQISFSEENPVIDFDCLSTLVVNNPPNFELMVR